MSKKGLMGGNGVVVGDAEENNHSQGENN